MRHTGSLLPALVLLLSIIHLPAPGEAADAPLVVDGRVVDGDGRAIAGATVRLERQTGLWQRLTHALRADGPEEVAADLAADRGITDERGIYRLRAGGAGLYRVIVGAPGRATYGISLDPLVSHRTLDQVVLPPSSDLVLGIAADGDPVAGALVVVEPRQRRRPTEWGPETRRLRTDDQGRAVVPWAWDEGWSLTAGTAHRLPVEREGDAAASRRLDLELPPGEVETLLLADGSGEPAADAVVALGDPSLPVGTADAEGRLRVTLPVVDAEKADPPDTLRSHTLRLHAASRDGGYLRGHLGADPESETIELELHPPQPVDGRVVDVASREPVAGALAWPYGHAPGLVRSDADGRFRVEALHGFPFVMAGAPGYRSERGRAEAGEIILALAPVRGLAGRVVDRRGEGIPDVAVSTAPDLLGARSSGEVVRLRESAGSAFTDEEGRFRIEGLLPDATYDVEARRDGYAPAKRRVTLSGEVSDEGSGAGLRRIVIVLDPGRMGAGQVVDEADRPVEGAEVALYEPPGEKPSIRVGPPEEPLPLATARTDSAGEYRLHDLGEGSWRLEIEAAGFAPLEIPGIEIPPFAQDAPPGDVSPDDDAAPPEIDLGVAVLIRGAEIHGRVVDDDDPVAGAAVFTGRQGSSPFDSEPLTQLPQAVTGPDGGFVLRDLEPRVTRRVVVRKEGFVERSVSGVVPRAPQEITEDDRVEIVLHGPSAIRGRVVTGDGAPVEGASVSPALVQNVGTASSFRMFGGTSTDASGAFEISESPPGDVRLYVDAEGYRRGETPLLRVEPGEDLDGVEVVLEEGAAATGRVLDPQGRPVVGATVGPRWPEGRRSHFGQSAESDAEGRFRVENLPAGSVEIVAHHPELGSAAVSAELVAGEESHVEIELGGGATVSGQVVTPEGEPAAGATVGVRPAESHRWRNERDTRTDADGRFEIPAVEDGLWVVVADHGEHGTVRSEELEVTGATISGLYLQLEPPAEVVGELRGLSFEELGSAEIFAVSPLGRRMGEVSHDGTYRVGRLAPGRWSLRAQAGGKETAGEVEIEPGERRATLDLDFGGGNALEGRVLLDGETVDGARVVAVAPGGDDRGATITDHRGSFRLEGLDDGPHQVLVTDLDTGLRHAADIDLPRADPLLVHVRTGSLHGLALDPEGRPLADARVTIEEAAEGVDGGEDADEDGDAGSDLSAMIRRRPPATTDARGVFRFGTLPVGGWVVTVEKEGYAAQERIVTLEAGERVGPLRIVLAPAAEPTER